MILSYLRSIILYLLLIVVIRLMGKRRLAYPINDLYEGYYVLMNFESKPEFPAELERVMKITEGVMRCLTTAVEE